MVTNLSKSICGHLRRLGYDEPEQNHAAAMTIWCHALTILHTPSYLRENRDALHRGWPRVPLPGFTNEMPADAARQALEESAGIGRHIGEILAGSAVPACPVCVATFTDGEEILDIAGARSYQLEVDGDWGVPGKWNAVRPRPGRVIRRPYKMNEMEALSAMAKRMGLTTDAWSAALGEEMVDVVINHRVMCRGIPAKVWDYAAGGRQVLAKWLSYRESRILNRPLCPDEATHFIDTARKLTFLRLLGPRLNDLWAWYGAQH